MFSNTFRCVHDCVAFDCHGQHLVKLAMNRYNVYPKHLCRSLGLTMILKDDSIHKE